VLDVRLGLLVGSILTALAFSGSAYAAPPCEGNKWVPLPAQGAFFITEYAAVRSVVDNCPTSDPFGAQFPYPRDRQLAVWFRLQGDSEYLATAAAKKPIKIRLQRIGSDHTSNQLLDIHDGLLRTDGASLETELNSERYFDWRFDADFDPSIVRPGTYMLELSQGGIRICPLSGPCSIRFMIEEPVEH
jgi:hypothetical protein